MEALDTIVGLGLSIGFIVITYLIVKSLAEDPHAEAKKILKEAENWHAISALTLARCKEYIAELKAAGEPYEHHQASYNMAFGRFHMAQTLSLPMKVNMTNLMMWAAEEFESIYQIVEPIYNEWVERKKTEQAKRINAQLAEAKVEAESQVGIVKV